MSGANFVSLTNACAQCTPLGAVLAFRGVEACVPFLHGSQGCATYMRRYVISHFREPMDIASSSLGEKQAVYGGGPNLKKGILNVMRKYGPAVVGVATTCLTETIGDDVPRLLAEFKSEFADLPLPELVHVSTPSFSGTHSDGFRDAVAALCGQLVREGAPANGTLNLLPGFVSPADVRHLKELCAGFGIAPTVLPDISQTLDRPALPDYETIPAGGTALAAIRALSGAAATVEFGRCGDQARSGGAVLSERSSVPLYQLGLPVGIRETDRFIAALGEVSGRDTPPAVAEERGRLIDALVDGHKYCAGLRAVVFGEDDLVAGVVSLLAEIGVRPVLAATGSRSSGFAAAVAEVCRDVLAEPPAVIEGADFQEIAEAARALSPDILLGHSKGYRYAREWNVPLVRVGFPVHDRFGGQRTLHLGFRGAQSLFDRIVNAVLERRQDENPVGYTYL
jgi:nitrogenase molybdenum-iron protein NifN